MRLIVKTRRVINLLLFVLFFAVDASFAQTESRIQFSTSNGLPADHVYSVIQDKKGFIWMATNKGVVKYNGYSFKVFTVSDGLPGNDIWRLYEDVKGRIWLFTQAHQQGYLENDQFRRIQLPDHQNLIVPKAILDLGDITIYHYWENNMGQLAILGGHFNAYLSEADLNRMWNVSMIQFEKPLIYTITNDDRIQQFSATRSIKEPVKSCPPKHTFPAFNMGANHHVPHNPYLYSYLSTTSTVRVFDYRTCAFDSIVFSNEKVLLVGNTNNRTYAITDKNIYSVEGARTKKIIDTRTIVDDQVTWYFTDKGNNTWITTTNSGLFLQSNLFKWKKYLSSDSELRNCTEVGVADGNTYWWNDETSELLMMKHGRIATRKTIPNKGTLRSVATCNNSLVLSFTTGLYSMIDGTIDQLFRPEVPLVTLDTQGTLNGGIVATPAKAHYIKGGYLHRISDTTMLICPENGVRLVRFSDDTTTEQKLDIQKVSRGVDVATTNYVLLFNKKSIVLYNGGNSSVRTIKADHLRKIGINQINDIVCDSSGNVFIQDVDKVVSYNILSRRYRTYQFNFSLEDVTMKHHHNELIFIGPFGVSIFHILKSGVLVRAATLINFKGQEMRKMHTPNVDALGNIMINSDDGLYKIPFDSAMASKGKQGQDFQFVLELPTSISIENGDTILIESPVSKLTFNAINFNGTGSLEYLYRLPHSGWQRSSSGELSLDGIKPDRHYTLQIQVKDKLWKSKVVTLHVFKRPEWYQSAAWKAVFWITGILLFAASLYAASIITRRRVAFINEKRRMQTELELRAIHSQINPHFIFNTLSTALYFMKTDQSKQAYEHVEKFSRLLRAYLRSSRERWTTLEEDILILEQYIQLQQIRLQHGLVYSIEVDPLLNPKVVMIPSLLLQPLVENAIHHGLFNKQGEGKLTISFKRDDEHELICTIEDNGIGRENARALMSKQPDSRKSYGTEMTSDLIQAFKQYERLDINLQYVDKQPPETGTTVIIYFKKIKKSTEATVL